MNIFTDIEKVNTKQIKQGIKIFIFLSKRQISHRMIAKGWTKLLIIFAILGFFSCLSAEALQGQRQFVGASPVGYRIGEIVSKKLLRTSQNSKLYELVVPELDDNRPIKLIDLHGSHYQIGYDYGFLLSDEIQYSYEVLFQNEFKSNKTLLTIFQKFFDWQYNSYIRKNLPIQFLNQIRGIKDGAFKSKKNARIQKIIERVLVLSSIPSTFTDDIPAVLQDELFKTVLRIKNQKLQNYLQSNALYVITKLREYFKKIAIHCSFFGVWGSRTKDGELYTARNLDWTSNSGVNLNKLVTIFTIDNNIPHATLGFPGLLGAITGISAKGITTHEAGQASDLQTLDGFQWTIRMRYLLGNANNLKEAIRIWNSTKNTLGMNFMFGSGSDKQAIAFQQMRGYSSIFFANDPRQNNTIFQDPDGQLYVAGYSMPDTIYRTNHGYDQVIRKHSHTKLRKRDSSTIARYFIQRDMLNSYENRKIMISEVEAINMTAIMGAKEHRNYYSCKQGPKGSNVISVTYYPKNLTMWAAWEYGSNDTFRSACCGVYVKIDLKPYFGITTQPDQAKIIQHKTDQYKQI